MRISSFLVLSALTLPAVAAMAQEGQMRDLTIQQTTVAETGVPRPGTLKVSLAADRQDATYAIGETVRLVVMTNEEAYVTVLNVGPSGQTFQLFPNQFQADNHMMPNRAVEIAGEGSGARITVSGPVGAELIKVIASNRPLPVIKEAELKGRGAFQAVEGGAQAVVRDLQVVGDQANQSGTKVAMMNFTIRTVGARP